jgi:hypothetical protein
MPATDRLRAGRCLLALALAAVACNPDSGLPSGTRCDDGVCAGPFVCSGGFCVRPDTLVDAGDDAPFGCGKVRQLADGFEGPELSRQWSRSGSGGGSIQVVAGSLQLVLPAGGDSGPAAAITSTQIYDLRASEISVAVPILGGPSHETTVTLEVSTRDGKRAAAIAHRGGQLLAIRRTPEGETMNGVAYDAAAHRYWRLAASGGQLRFQAAAGGSGPWTTFFEVESPPWLDSVRVELRHDHSTPLTDTLIAQLEDLNGGLPVGRPCPLAALSDAFDNEVEAPLWFASPATGWCNLREMGGELVITPAVSATPPPNGGQFCRYETVRRYELDGSSITASVNEMIGSAVDGYVDIVLLEDGAGVGVGFWVVAGRLLCQRGQENVCDLAYSAEQHRHVRLSVADGTMRWETSPDGVAFDTAVVQPSPYDDPSVVMSTGMYIGTAPAEPSGVYRLAAINAPP